MLQKMTKRIRRARYWYVEIQFAAINQNERGCGENGLRKTPPGDERLRLGILGRLSGDDPHHIEQPQ